MLSSEEENVIFNNIGNTHFNIKNSDIIILGNSRMQHCWDASNVRKICNDNNIRIFNMSCANGMGYPFYYYVLKSLNINNKIVLIHVDNLWDNISEPAKNVLNQKNKFPLSSFLMKQTQARIHNLSENILPEWLLSELFGLSRFAIVFKSFKDGFWDYRSYGDLDYEKAKCQEKYIGVVDFYDNSFLKKVVENLKSKGCIVLFTQAPNLDSSSRDVIELSNKAGVSTLLYTLPYETLGTVDRSHLNAKSAILFTKNVLPRLVLIAANYKNHKKMP